ncbi:MAG: FHA domain-containing protein [Sandaracinaceae bacterium]
MVAPEGHRSLANAWARAHLRRGSSTGQVWEISSEYPEARLTLGGSGDAGWQIDANGVRPVHCELFWDGEALWVADIHAVGGVFLDGSRVSDWVQIHGPAELRFGQAALDIETSVPQRQRMASKPELARPATMTDIGVVLLPEQPSTARFGGAAGDVNVPDLDAEKTRLAAPPGMNAALAADPMRIGVQAPPTIRDDLRPRLGGNHATAHPLTSAATRMVSLPNARSGPPPPPPPGRQANGPAPIVAPPPPRFDNLAAVAPMVGPSAVVAPVTAPPPPSFAAPPSAERAPTATTGASLDAPAAPGSSAVEGAPIAEGASPFAPPPTGPDAGAGKSPGFFKRVFGQSGEGAPTGRALPTRTWILLSVTVLAAVGLLLWDDEPEVATSPPSASGAPVVAVGAGPADPTQANPTGANPAQGDPTQGGSTQGGSTQGDPTQGGSTQGDPSQVDPTLGDPTAPHPIPIQTGAIQTGTPVDPSAIPVAGSTGEEGAELLPELTESGATWQRAAVDALLAGRHDDALAHYRRLAERHPEDASYSTIVRVLERQQRERCTDGRTAEGEPCVQRP